MASHVADYNIFLTRQATEDVVTERLAQVAKWGNQRHTDGTGGLVNKDEADRARAVADRHADTGHLTWADILKEEFYEALAETDRQALRAELVQVAAVAVAWIEDLDTRG